MDLIPVNSDSQSFFFFCSSPLAKLFQIYEEFAFWYKFLDQTTNLMKKGQSLSLKLIRVNQINDYQFCVSECLL